MSVLFSLFVIFLAGPIHIALCSRSIFPADPDFLPVTFITAHFINKMSSRVAPPPSLTTLNPNMRVEKDLSRRQRNMVSYPRSLQQYLSAKNLIIQLHNITVLR